MKPSQILALYNKSIRRLTKYIKLDLEKKVESKLGLKPKINQQVNFDPIKSNTKELIGTLKHRSGQKTAQGQRKFKQN